jgi:hypothetical protein
VLLDRTRRCCPSFAPRRCCCGSSPSRRSATSRCSALRRFVQTAAAGSAAAASVFRDRRPRKTSWLGRCRSAQHCDTGDMRNAAHCVGTTLNLSRCCVLAPRRLLPCKLVPSTMCTLLACTSSSWRSWRHSCRRGPTSRKHIAGARSGLLAEGLLGRSAREI